MSVICQKCLCYRSGDLAGDPCRTPGCDGVIERQKEWNELVDALPEPMTCGRRMRGWGPWEHREGLDHWDKFKAPHGNRVCSFCGSLHPDDLWVLAKAATEADENAAYGSVPEIEMTDKGYKFYITQPGVRNAHEGAIKFYTAHFPAKPAESPAQPGTMVFDLTEEQRALFFKAVTASSGRRERLWNSCDKANGLG
jgi:hypothetical protein